MNPAYKDETPIRRYLLGEITDQEREQVEQQLMADSQYFHHFLRTEENLIDEYVSGGLIEGERKQFETHFLSAPERRDRLEFAKSLSRYIAEAETPESADVANAGSEAAPSRGAIFWLRRSPARAAIALLAVAMPLLLAGTIALLIENARLKEQVLERQEDLSQVEEILQRQLGEQTERNNELARQLEQSQNDISRIEQEMLRLKREKIRRRESAVSGIASLIIMPGAVRDKGQANRAYLTNDVQRLRLELQLQEENHESYRAEVQTVEGKSIWTEDNLRARGRTGEKTLVTTLPTSRLPEGDYLLTLSAAEPGGGYEVVAKYYFTILRK